MNLTKHFGQIRRGRDHVADDDSSIGRHVDDEIALRTRVRASEVGERKIDSGAEVADERRGGPDNDED